MCEKCQQKQATVHMQQVINGEKSEYHLCQECASHAESPFSFEHFFQGLLNVFAMAYDHDQDHEHGQETGGAQKHVASPGPRCPVCKMSFLDFKNAGKLGCGECYKTFNREMDAVLKNVQGSSLHQGKFPRKFGAGMMAGRKLEHLRASLAKAIADEAYEEAARLRDVIKALREGGERDE